MPAARRLLIGAVPLALLVTACVSDDEDTAAGDAPSAATESPTETGTDEHAEAEACLQGTWAEDMDNLLAQWKSWNPAGGQGLPVTGVEGQNTLTVTEASMTYAVDSVVTTESPAAGGITMTGEAVTSGSAVLEYDVRSPTAMTVGPVTEQGVTSTTRVLIDGRVSSETPIPWDGGLEGDAVWWCDGDSLSLEPAVSGWIHLFERTG